MLLIFVIIFTQASFSRWISIGEQPTRRGGIRKSPKDDGIDAQGTRAGAVSTGREKVLSHIAHAYLHPELIVEGVYCKRKVVAFAVTLTKDGNHLDGAAVLATSIGKVSTPDGRNMLPALVKLMSVAAHEDTAISLKV